MGIQKRNIVTCIIFSLITCGIYGLYWVIKLNDEANALTNRHNEATGGMVLLLTIVTCGIYGWYWVYKQGDKMEQLRAQSGMGPSSLPVTYLLLSIFGLAIVSYALMQNEINNYLDSSAMNNMNNGAPNPQQFNNF